MQCTQPLFPESFRGCMFFSLSDYGYSYVFMFAWIFTCAIFRILSLRGKEGLLFFLGGGVRRGGLGSEVFGPLCWSFG